MFFGANTNVGKQRLWFMWSSSQKKKRNHIFVILQSGLARVFLNTVSQGRTRPNCFQLFAWTCGNRNFAFRSVSILSKWILRPASICWKACDHLLEDLQICLKGFQANHFCFVHLFFFVVEWLADAHWHQTRTKSNRAFYLGKRGGKASDAVFRNSLKMQGQQKCRLANMTLLPPKRPIWR